MNISKSAILGCILLFPALPACTDSSTSNAAVPAAASKGWYTVWSTAQTPADGLTAAPSISNGSIRVVARMTGGGDQLRVRLSNYYGSGPAVVNAASVALRESGASVSAPSLRTLTFAGQPAITIPPGESVQSDAAPLATLAQQDVIVSLHLTATRASRDANAWATSYDTGSDAGDHTRDPTGAAFTHASSAAVLLEEVSAHGQDLAGSVIAVGGSVVDGVGSDQDGYNRWTDVLGRRFNAELPAPAPGMGNAGISGNTTADVLARFEQDVLARTGLSHVILFAGTNDLTLPSILEPVVGDSAASAATIIANMRSLIAKTHQAGARIIVSTISPRITYTPIGNADRAEVNAWIRAGGNCGGECDGIVDFDAVLAWPLYPNAINPLYDSGDTVHPNPEGYRAMADSIDLRIFR